MGNPFPVFLQVHYHSSTLPGLVYGLVQMAHGRLVVIGELPLRVCGVDKHRQEGSYGFTSSWYSLASGKVCFQENSS